jgi:multidrug efflux system membrane fusion protein
MSIHRALLFFGLGASAAACSKPPEQHTPAVPVQVATVTKISAPVTIVANGVVEPLHTVAVQAQVGGIITAVEFTEGADVQAGQVLFRIDARPYEAALRQAEAALARDEAQAQNAQRDADRYKALVEKDYVTKSQADQAAATAASMAATVQSDHATVDNAKLNLAYTTIKAPISGRTGRLLVRQGNLAKPNADPLVVINQLRPILVRFPVSQRDFPALQRRQARSPVLVRVVTADSGRVGDVGALAFLDNAVDSLTGTVTAKARFDNQNSGLWPGEYVSVSAELDVQSGALAIPTKALQAGQQGSYVFVVGANKVATIRQVDIGRAVGELTTIDKGLEPGETVVTDGQSRLTPNSKVEAKAAPPAGATATKAMP